MKNKELFKKIFRYIWLIIYWSFRTLCFIAGFLFTLFVLKTAGVIGKK